MIKRFTGEHFYLSNFSTEGAIKPTVEHQFQARKATTVRSAIYVMAAESPREAKKRGRSIQCLPNWDDIRLDVMWELVYDKFYSDPALGERLLSTGDQGLVEGNTWGDTFWGVCRGKGENNLGIILMDVRKELREY